MDTLAKSRALHATFENIKSNKAFELFVVSVIIFSAVVIGVKTYNIPDYLSQIIVVTDWLITVVFLVEITIRFLAEERKRAFFSKGWNIFDTAIVIVSLIPIEDSELALVGRLVRIFRVLRMVSIIPELRILLNSLIKAMPQLGYVMLLMFIIFYIYAAIGTTFFAQINETLWGDIAVSLLTLFRVMTFEDWTDVMYETMAEYPWSWVFYLSFIFFTAFAFLNMVIGIVVGVLDSEQSKAANEALETQSAEADSELAAIRVELQEIKRMLAAQGAGK